MTRNAKKAKQYEVRVNIKNQIILDPVEPVPIPSAGSLFRYNATKKYIPFIGAKDNYANTLLQLRLESPTQHACISTISKSLVGRGISIVGVDEPDPDWVKWTKSVNGSRESFNEVLVQAIEGERTYGNQFVFIGRGSVGGKRFVKIKTESFLICRLVSPVEEFDEPDSVVISREFGGNGYYTVKDDAKPIPLWSFNPLKEEKNWTNIKGVEWTAIHFKNKVSGVDTYGLPDSIGGVRHQSLEAKAAQYNIDNFDNNMVLGGMLIFKSSMTQDEAVEAGRDIVLSHIGNGKTGRIAVVSSEQGSEVEFIPYSTQKEGSYIDFDKRTEEKIIMANQWDSILCGINRSTSLGNGSNYIRSIWDVKDAALLHPLRMKLIDKVAEPILAIWADWMQKPDVAKYEMNLQTNMPFSYMADLDPNEFFLIQEARAKAGLPFDPRTEGMYLAELKAQHKHNVQSTTDTTQATNLD